MKKQPCSCEMHSKGFFPSFEYMKPIFNSHLWQLFQLILFWSSHYDLCSFFPSWKCPREGNNFGRYGLLLLHNAHWPLLSNTKHTCILEKQNTPTYLKNETHRHTWNTNTCIHRASLKDKTHRHALHKAAVPLPNGHLASLPWPAAVLCLFVGKNYQERCRASAITAWIINGYLLKNKWQKLIFPATSQHHHVFIRQITG